MPRRKEEEGFTLIEILIVVTIIGLLVTFLGTKLFPKVGTAKHKVAQLAVTQIAGSLESYQLDNGRYPTSEQGLDALVRPSTADPVPRNFQQGGYLKSDQMLDPWQNAWRYESPGRINTQTYDLSSLGRDNKEGGQGEDADITNWDTSQQR